MTWKNVSSGLGALVLGSAGSRGLRGLGAASASGSGGLSPLGWLAVAGVGAAVLAGYLIACSIWPYGPCFGCTGHRGRNRGSNSRRWGRCKRCKGSGERIRWGYRLVQNLRGGGS